MGGAQSRAEADLTVMTQDVCELLCLKSILEDIEIRWKKTIRLYSDNESTINIAHNPIQDGRIKHNRIACPVLPQHYQ